MPALTMANRSNDTRGADAVTHPFITRCTHCGSTYTVDTFSNLPLVGQVHYPPEMLEMRNCCCAPIARTISIIVSVDIDADQEYRREHAN